MGQALFRAARHPEPADAGGDRARHVDVHDVGAARHAGDPERDPDAVLRHDAVRGARASASSPPRSCWRSACGGSRAPRRARAPRGRRLRRRGRRAAAAVDDPQLRERAALGERLRPGGDAPRARERAGARRRRGRAAADRRGGGQPRRVARRDAAPRPRFLASERWGGASVASVSGVWSVLVALAAGDRRARGRSTAGGSPSLRETVDAGSTASVLPVLSVASLVGFGAVVAAMPAFAVGARLGAVDRRRTARVARGGHQHPRRVDGVGVGRPDDRAGGARRPVHAARGRARTSTPR